MTLEDNRLIASPSRAAEFRRLKEHVEARLEEADVRVARSVSLPYGSKKNQTSNHEQATTQEHPSEIYGNYTIHGGDGLVILDIDVDDLSDLPEWVTSLPETLTVETVHDGLHLYYTVEDDSGISNAGSPSWGSVRYDGWYGVGPGSAVDHDAECGNCGKNGRTAYEIIKDCSIATLSGDDIDNLRDVCQSEEDDTTGDTSSASTGSNAGFTEPDEAFTDEAEKYICTEFVPRHTTELAGSDLMDFLRGGTGSYHLRRDDDPDSIDRSKANYYVLEWLYGAFLFRGDDSDTARERALAVFKRYCLENDFDKTGNKRKWLQKGDSYLTGEGVDWDGQMDAVEEEFDFGAWHRWRRRRYEDGFDPDEHRPWTDRDKDGKPSQVTKDTVRAAVSILVRGVDPEWAGELYRLDISSLYASEDDSSSDSTTLFCSSCREICTPLRACSCGDTSRSESRKYPTAKEVGRLAVALNPDREKSYFEETLKQLQRGTGEFARAVCDNRENGQRHVYFPSGIEPPDDADEVHCNGEQYEPGLFPESKHNDSKEDEQRLVTDGGTDFKNPSVTWGMSEDGTEELDPNDLEPHPKAGNRYPADEQRELDLSDGQRESIEVTRNSRYTDTDTDTDPVIIDGHRRVEALLEAGESTADAEFVGPFENRHEELKAILDYNDYREKTPGEKVIDAFDHILVLEDRVEEGLENFPSGYRSELDDLFTDSGRTLRKGMKVKWAAERGEFEGQEIDEEIQSVAEREWEVLLYDENAPFDGAINEINDAIERRDKKIQRAQLADRDDLHITPQEEADREIDTKPLPEPVRPFVWYGGKANLADWIISRMPEHETYVEPFAGQAGVLFNKPPSRVEVLNDFDTDVTTFFEVLRDKRELLEGSAVSIPYFDESHDRLADRWFDGEMFEDDVVSAAVFLFLTHAQLYGKMSSKSSFDPTTPTSYYKRVQEMPSLQQRLTRDSPDYFRERFAGEVDDVAVLAEQRLRDINEGDEVQIRNDDFETVLREYDSEDTLAYVDPPYYGTEEHYSETFEEDDHQRLVNTLNDFDGDWILSYGSEPPEGLQTEYVESPRTVIRSPGQEEKGTEGEEWLITNIPEGRIGTFETVRKQKPADEW